LKGGWGISKTKGHLSNDISAESACECSLLLVFKGKGNLGIAGVPIKKAI